jgi:hypothetical protein
VFLEGEERKILNLTCSKTQSIVGGGDDSRGCYLMQVNAILPCQERVKKMNIFVKAKLLKSNTRQNSKS